MQGVYKITNTQNGKIYIGSSHDIQSRWIDHQSKLRNNNHCNTHLQNAWNKYGADVFELSIAEEVVDSDDLIGREQHYIDTLSPEYNIRPKADRSELSEETKRKIGEAVEGENHPFYGEHHTEETKQKISEAQKGENHPFYGKERSESVKQKISEAEQGKEGKFGRDNPFYGKEHTEEAKRKMSNSTRDMSGKNNPSSELTEKKVKVIKYLLNGNSFSHNEISKMYGVAKSTITAISTGRNWGYVEVKGR